MSTPLPHPLAALEPRLRSLLPAMLYASAWVEPTSGTLIQVFDHLRTLRRMLQDYVPRFVAESPRTPGLTRYDWQEGTLMFTDLAGFTSLMEANAAAGKAGAEALVAVLNSYFAEMVEIISKSGGNLLEWTGDAMLVQFPADKQRNITAQAVRAGLRMQRAMARFGSIETPAGMISLGMRIGLHTGRFIAADIGTPRRMEYVLLGDAVQDTKAAESAGAVGRVCLSAAAHAAVAADFRSAPAGTAGYFLVEDDLAQEQLGEYELVPSKRRQAGGFLLDRSVGGILRDIEESVGVVEQLAAYLPAAVLALLVESAARRTVPPQFLQLAVLFVNLIGLTEVADHISAEDEQTLMTGFSRVFSLINAAVDAQGGILKNVTYDRAGSNILIYFGVTNAHTDDPLRAARAALDIQRIVTTLPPLGFSDRTVAVTCKIGMAFGPAFAAEIGEPRGRREFNLLGDAVNTAARLMGAAATNQILLDGPMERMLDGHFASASLGALALKGKAAPTPIFGLLGRVEE
ncbi:MAG TPA: adenylate/guanylate cyclase domain-containing protein [Herpetosiphonaceae bacterium]|nr:adenylate/guanylate cyclase domain-containing protein [Herpetosiphonaceae bacterium]